MDLKTDFKLGQEAQSLYPHILQVCPQHHSEKEIDVV